MGEKVKLRYELYMYVKKEPAALKKLKPQTVIEQAT